MRSGQLPPTLADDLSQRLRRPWLGLTEHRGTASSSSFGIVEGKVGACQQGVEAPAALASRDAHAETERNLRAVKLGRAGGVRQQSCGDLRGRLHSFARQQHDQLVTAVAPHDIEGTDVLLAGTREGSKYAVSARMALSIVDRLEVIDVYHQTGQGAIASLGSGEGSLSELHAMPAIRQTR